MIQSEVSPSTNILIDPINELTLSREFIIHQKNMDRIDELERKLNVENTWTSCCLKTDKRAIIYFSQLSISCSAIALCMFQLIKYPDDCNNNNLYIGLLTFLLGVYLPQPKIHK